VLHSQSLTSVPLPSAQDSGHSEDQIDVVQLGFFLYLFFFFLFEFFRCFILYKSGDEKKKLQQYDWISP